MLDEKDVKILHELQQDSRMTISSLSKVLKMPRATIQNRIRRMKENGIIKKFTLVADYKRLGRPVTAFILVSFLPGSDTLQRRLAEEIAKIEGVCEVHLISGEWDILLKVRGRSIEEIGELVIDRLRLMKGVGKTVTCACFSTVKEEP